MKQLFKLLIFIPFLLTACDRSPDLPYIDQYDFDSLITYQTNRNLEILEKNKIAGASIILFDSNSILFDQQYGYFDSKSDSVSNQTLFKIASITKLMTAIAVLKLVDDGLCSLDDPVSKYLPTFSVQSADLNEITIRSLLTHHSGLERDIWDRAWGENHGDVDDLIQTLQTSVLAKDPNTVFSYSNIGYSLLEKLIEQVSGGSYQDYIQTNLFEPYNLNAFSFSEKQAIYGFRKYNKKTTIPHRDIAAGGLISNAMDLSRFGQLILATKNNQLLSKKQKSYLFSPQNKNIPLDLNMKIGFGTMIQENVRSFHTPLVSRTGGSIYHRSALMFVPEFDLGIVVLINSPSYQAIYRIITETLANAIMVKTGKRSIPKKSIVDTQLEPQKMPPISDYIGTYMSPMGEIVFKPFSEGKLKTKFLNQNFEIYQNDNGYLQIKYLLLGVIPISLPFMDAFKVYMATDNKRQYLITKRYGKKYLVAEKLRDLNYSQDYSVYLGAYAPEAITGEYMPIESAKLFNENGFYKIKVKSEVLKDFTMFIDELTLILEEVNPGTFKVFGNQPGWNGTLNFSQNQTNTIYLSGKKFIKINKLKYANK